MNTDEKQPSSEGRPEQPKHTVVPTQYAGPSRVEVSGEKSQLALYADLNRAPVKFEGKIADPLRFREALSVLYAIVGSDYRYVPKDRTAYIAYMRMKRESSPMNVWQAQQAYFQWLIRNDPLAFCLLDPVVSVHPDRVFFEVFSKDESTYAMLGLDHSAFEIAGNIMCGTTNIDFSKPMFDGVQQIRSYRATTLNIGKEQVKLDVAGVGEKVEKQVHVPDTWLRGFLQVQSAATMPFDTISLLPMDVYNLLRYLRMHADKKGKRRGLRVELVPGETPRLVLEPWETVLPTSGTPFKGKQAKVIRVWGRRRLMLLKRMLPYTEQLDVHMLGSGLPSFWVMRAAGMTLTMGLTGFTSANWSQAVSFDLLLPRKTQGSRELDSVLGFLGKVWFADARAISEATGLKGPALVETLQMGCQQGKLMFDISKGVYRLRPLTEAPIDLGRLEYRNQRERQAHDLLVRRDAVKILTENRIAGMGLELTGQVAVAEDRRDYRPKILLGDEGQVSRAECTCTQFRKQGLKGGPCTHLIALRLAHAAEEVKRRESGGSGQAVVVETRSYSKRDERGEENVMQLSLERQRIRVRWGKAGQVMRLQTLRFNTVEEARAAYLVRIDELNAKGYLDATAG